MIKFVYFDLGGVVDIDFSGNNKYMEMKRDMGITADKDEEFDKLWDQLESEICVGRDTDSVLGQLVEKFNLHLPVKYSLLMDGFVNRFEANKSIWLVINSLQEYCKVGLLTNMYPGMFTAIKNRGLLPEVSWDKIIDSSIEGIQKPDPRIFQLAERKANTKGQEILFVENSPGHVKAASAFGWQTFPYDSAHPEDSSKKLLELCGTLFSKQFK